MAAEPCDLRKFAEYHRLSSIGIYQCTEFREDEGDILWVQEEIEIEADSPEKDNEEREKLMHHMAQRENLMHHVDQTRKYWPV
ncbi:UNVERIFIED_CONTAM: hypothetical protein FKN15_035898 [Acipenser sinensis]